MVSDKQGLAGKVAVITGGGTGLGKATALALAGAGAGIVVAARRVELIEETAAEVAALGVKGLAIPTDVTDSGQVNRLIERTLKEMGRIDILINNAGIVRGAERKQIWDLTDDDWHLGMDTNLSGTFYCCRAVSRYLVDQKRGKVINVSSGYGLRGGRDNYMYACAKGAVIQLTRSLALTWAGDNIQVNCIVPGFIDVSSLRPGPRTPPLTRGEFIPVGRLGVPEDISSLALFLCSDASDYITGAMFAVDGGALAGGYSTTGYAPVIAMEED